jgi:hypothetical protein
MGEENSQKAKQILRDGTKLFTDGNAYWEAMYARSLAEFAFHEGEKEGAVVLFDKAQFDDLGLTSQKMDKFIREEYSEGWRWFAEGV